MDECFSDEENPEREYKYGYPNSSCLLTRYNKEEREKRELKKLSKDIFLSA